MPDGTDGPTTEPPLPEPPPTHPNARSAAAPTAISMNRRREARRPAPPRYAPMSSPPLANLGACRGARPAARESPTRGSQIPSMALQDRVVAEVGEKVLDAWAGCQVGAGSGRRRDHDVPDVAAPHRHPQPPTPH